MSRDHHTLRRAGEALYGDLWQTALSEDTGVALRTMQRWAAGTYPIPAGLWPEIAALARARGKTLIALALELETTNPD